MEKRIEGLIILWQKDRTISVETQVQKENSIPHKTYETGSSTNKWSKITRLDILPGNFTKKTDETRKSKGNNGKFRFWNNGELIYKVIGFTKVDIEETVVVGKTYNNDVVTVKERTFQRSPRRVVCLSSGIRNRTVSHIIRF